MYTIKKYNSCPCRQLLLTLKTFRNIKLSRWISPEIILIFFSPTISVISYRSSIGFGLTNFYGINWIVLVTIMYNQMLRQGTTNIFGLDGYWFKSKTLFYGYWNRAITIMLFNYSAFSFLLWEMKIIAKRNYLQNQTSFSKCIIFFPFSENLFGQTIYLLCTWHKS